MASARVSSAGVLTAPAPEGSGRRGTALPAALAVVVLAGLGGGIAGLVDFESRPLTLDGVELPRGEDPEAFVRALAAQWYDTEVTIDAGTRILRMSRRDLGGTIDVERAVEETRLARGFGPIWSRAWAFVARREASFGWRRDVRQGQTQEVVEDLRTRVTVDPRIADHRGDGGAPGATINPLGATSALTDALRTDALYVRLPVRRLEPPTETQRDRSSARFGEVVAAHETRFAYGAELVGRARNIELATRFLDGAVIEPHGELSFNEVVGERSFERGFAPAIELARGGRRTEGIGGGVCQVAATLHAAAFFAGFDIPEHHPHTRNSSYIPAGLDSAVSWPNKDVRIRNPYPFHVRVRATAYRGRLRVELMGARRAPRVEWNTRIVQRTRAGVEREIDPAMPPGAEEVLDEGEDGSLMERTRTVFWPDGAVTDTVNLRYPVVHALVRSGPQGGRASGPSSSSEAP